MSTSPDTSLRNLNDCGCCEGTSPETPLTVFNRAGLSAIAYRVGTHADFKESLLARLSGARLPALTYLTTRNSSDFTIALLDAWAVVSDVLTFYQERIANETYLRTATERFSVLELARLIDYQLRPGVAASTYLAFTLEDAPGALGQSLSLGTTAQLAPEPIPPLALDAGIKVQSVPAPGEQAQTFETVEKIEARPEWNAMRPRMTQPQQLSENMSSIYLKGTALNIKSGDEILITISATNNKVRTVLGVAVDEDAKTTRLDFVSTPPAPPTHTRPNPSPGNVNDFQTKVALDEIVIDKIIASTWSGADIAAIASIQGWNVRSLALNIRKRLASKSGPPDAGAFAFHQRAAAFGYNAPNYDSLPAKLRVNTTEALYRADGTFDRFVPIPAAYPTSWENRTLNDDAEPSGGQCSIYLDSSYPAIVANSWIALKSPEAQPAVYRVKDNQETTRSRFTISAKVSRLRVEPFAGLANFKMRLTSVLGQSEQLQIAETPIEDIVQGTTITLDGAYVGLLDGQRVIVTGERNDLRGVFASEVARVKQVILEFGFTVLVFESSLAYKYVRKTVKINANVAPATHGESVREVLGGGDATQAFQRFTLRQPPLTYVSASNPAGADTTLEVRVNDILWREVPSFFGHGPDERIYVTRLSDDGKTTVIFGDGKTGARLPTGQENVAAKYRKGIGLGGLVRADQLTQLMTRPLGLKGATNPVASSGAADAERLEEARNNAPLTVLTLGRVVSLQDYEDFARAFSGIEKSLATWTWFGERRGIFLTVAGASGADVPEGSKLHTNLLAAIRAAGDPNVPLKIQTYQPRYFRLSARIAVHPDYLTEKVFAKVEERLRDRFSFKSRAFGQPVSQSEAISVIQDTEGVVATDIKEFYRADQPIATPPPRLEARRPQAGDEDVFAAELLTLDPHPVGLEVMQ
jgi:predicted phage baseplate assembly protein